MSGDPQLLTTHLAAVSRTFYLTLKILPVAVRPQIGLAYLLARTTDTIADTDLVPVERRLEALETLRERIQGVRTSPITFTELAGKQSSIAEKALLDKCEMSVALLETLTDDDRALVRQVLQTITSGQALDLNRFAHATASAPIALGQPEELDDYTYRVAGCVGEFWTRICRRHLFPEARLDDAALLQDGVRFGKGLQLVNILRDLSGDLRNGRCYFPESELRAFGLAPSDLLETQNEQRFRPLFEKYSAIARGHLEAGWRYTCALPFRCLRVRLACAWPILLGLQTLDLLARHSALDPGEKVKVRRRDVKMIMLRSVVFYPFPAVWNRLGSPSDHRR